MIDLANKPIVITGASSGIGAETAALCAQAGMPVVLGARRADRLRTLADQIIGAGGRAVWLECDVADPDQCRALIEACRSEFATVYAVLANAGYGLERAVMDTTDEDLRRIYEVNVFGTLNVVRPGVEAMLSEGQGHVLMTSSVLSKIGVPYYAAYSSSKAMQDHLARAMRHELRARGIHVSSVHPVGTRTEFFDVAAESSGGRLRIAGTGDRFMQAPRRVARAIMRCLRRPRGEVWTSVPARTAVGLATIMPGLTDAVLARMLRSRERGSG